MGANVDEVQACEQPSGYHEATAKGRARVIQRAPRQDHVAQREEHCQRHDHHYKECAHCRTIKQPPPASRAQQSEGQVSRS